MRRFKVLHLITHLGNGGALDNTLLTVERLPRALYEVHLAAGPTEPGYTCWQQRGRQCADQLFICSGLQRRTRLVQDYRACREVEALIREQRYDVVHTHCAKAGVLGRIAARRAGVPIVVHTCHAFASQVTRTPHDSVWKGLANRVKCGLFEAAERRAGRLSDRVITVCEQNRRQALEQQLAPPDKLTTIYSGIDLPRFEVKVQREEMFAELDLDPHRPLVAFIGRLAEQKAPLDFVAAAHMVLSTHPDTQFVIAGDGPLAEQVQTAIGGRPNIRCLGFFERVPELLAACDVLAVSSLWEGLGRSVTEALLMGVPVAATAVDGIPELVIHEQSGLLSPPRAPDSLAENIVRLLDDREFARSLAQRGRERVGSEFGADRMVQRIDELYRQLLAEKGLLPD